jgi:large subunit ribosomal protein L9
MKLILTQEVKKLGKKGDLVDVSDGYARNFLLPHKLAIQATSGQIKALEHLDLEKKSKKQRELTKHQAIIEELQKLTFITHAKCGEGGKLFGSITNHDISEIILKKAKIEIDKHYIHIKEPIKHLGVYKVLIKLDLQSSGEITLEVLEDTK